MRESEINLTITIKHDESLPFDSQEIAQGIAQYVAGRVDYRLAQKPVNAWGRFARVGGEVGLSVRTFIRSAFIG